MAPAQADISFARRIYKHQPLGVEKHQIRLLKRCSSSGHTMEYRLTTFDFESAPKYVALSYTWGDKCPTGFISIDGKEFEVRMNLLNFLRTYETDEFLWIDQVCIDQSNRQERNHQVARMSEIYSQCHFVLVWLRDDSTHIPSTKQAALDFNNGLQSYTKHDYGKEGSRDEKEYFGSPTLALLHNPYFDRLWIVQELLLAKSIRLLVEGNVEVSWDSLQRHKELDREVREKLPATSWLVKATSLRNLFASHNSVSMTNYVTLNVSIYCNKKCENPRDKVYGLMALVRPSSKVEIDYAKSVQQVYLDTIMSMMREYLCMTFGIYDNELGVYKLRWPMELSIKASRGLAQVLGFTDREMSGIRSFVDRVWERVRRYEATVKSFNLGMNAETHCITSVGFEPGMHQLARYWQLVSAPDR